MKGSQWWRQETWVFIGKTTSSMDLCSGEAVALAAAAAWNRK